MKRRTVPSNAGFTVVELFVAAAIIGIVGVIVTAVFRDTVSHAAYNYQETDMISEKIQALQYFRSDITGAPASSLGSLLTNGDFEQESTGWPASATGTGSLAFNSDISTLTIRSGLGSLSITSSDGSQVFAEATASLSLTEGSAYFLTGYVRSSGGGAAGGYSLIDDNGDVVGSTSTALTVWTKIWVRYPSSGVYVSGTVPSDHLTLRVFASGGTSSVNFDDVAFSPSTAILADSTLDINVPTSGSGNISDASGYRFKTNGESGQVLHRYRVETKNEENELLREDFNGTSWVPSAPSVIARGFTTVRFAMTDPSTDPSHSRLPITVIMGFPSGVYENTHEKFGVWTFTPMVQ